jgi:hypothetical protein
MSAPSPPRAEVAAALRGLCRFEAGDLETAIPLLSVA